MTAPNPNPWQGLYKIPWNDPDFSRRMLAEHLTQDHDLASRRIEFIDHQIKWIDEILLHSQPANILDLGCGPGFYAHRLTKLNHHLTALDFSPASITYANKNNPNPERCTFTLADIRTADYQGPHDLAMLLYGEFNVFSPSEIKSILTKIHQSLTPNAKLIIEPQTFIAVQQTAQCDASEYTADAGLFSDHPHHVLMQNNWLTDHQTSVQTFTVTDSTTGQTTTYTSTTKAWTHEEIQFLLSDAGFTSIIHHTDWPTNTEGLTLYSAQKF